MAVEGAGYYHVLICLLLCAPLAGRSGRHTQFRDSPTPFQRRLSLTNVGVGKNITGDTELTSAMKEVFCCFDIDQITINS